MWRAHDRLAPDVERRVDEHRAPCLSLELTQEIVVVGVRLTTDRLNTGRVVDVRDSGNVGAYDIELFDAPETLLLRRHWHLALAFDGRDQQHVGTFAVQLEVLGGPFPQHAGSERAEPFAKLDLEIHLSLHPGASRITKNRARA